MNKPWGKPHPRIWSRGRRSSLDGSGVSPPVSASVVGGEKSSYRTPTTHRTENLHNRHNRIAMNLAAGYLKMRHTEDRSLKTTLNLAVFACMLSGDAHLYWKFQLLPKPDYAKFSSCGLLAYIACLRSEHSAIAQYFGAFCTQWWWRQFSTLLCGFQLAVCRYIFICHMYGLVLILHSSGCGLECMLPYLLKQNGKFCLIIQNTQLIITLWTKSRWGC